MNSSMTTNDIDMNGFFNKELLINCWIFIKIEMLLIIDYFQNFDVYESHTALSDIYRTFPGA